MQATVTWNKLILIINPNHPKSSKILKGHFFGKQKSALLETGTFTSSNGAKLLPGKKYQAISAEYGRSTKTLLHACSIALDMTLLHW